MNKIKLVALETQNYKGSFSDRMEEFKKNCEKMSGSSFDGTSIKIRLFEGTTECGDGFNTPSEAVRYAVKNGRGFYKIQLCYQWSDTFPSLYQVISSFIVGENLCHG